MTQTAKLVNLDDICIDAGTQARVKLSQATIDDYAEQIKDGAEFKPVIIYADGIRQYLVDGFHRYFAHQQAGREDMAAYITNNTLRAAIKASLSVNSRHGLPRTHADKRKSVRTALDDFEWQDESDAEIAKMCDVSKSLVRKMREELNKPRDAVKYKTMTGKDAVRAVPAKDKAVAEPVVAPKQEENHDKEAMQMLNQDVERLTARVAVAAMEATEDEKTMAQTMLDDYREQIRILTIEVEAVKRSRDTYQNENSQLMKQVAMLQRQLKKVTVI